MSFICETFAAPEPSAGTIMPEEPPARAVIASTETVLLATRLPDVALAIWLRDMPGSWKREVAPLLRAGSFRAHGEGTPEDALDALAAALPAPASMDLLADALRLARMFGALTRSDHLRIRLDGITGDACRKFHVDAVGFRMLVTYAGPGTQWTMGDPEDGAAAHEVPMGAVALFRGRARPGGHVLHRSPPLSHLPEARRARLVLCIDEAGCC